MPQNRNSNSKSTARDPREQTVLAIIAQRRRHRAAREISCLPFCDGLGEWFLDQLAQYLIVKLAECEAEAEYQARAPALSSFGRWVALLVAGDTRWRDLERHYWVQKLARRVTGPGPREADPLFKDLVVSSVLQARFVSELQRLPSFKPFATLFEVRELGLPLTSRRVRGWIGEVTADLQSAVAAWPHGTVTVDLEQRDPGNYPVVFWRFPNSADLLLGYKSTHPIELQRVLSPQSPSLPRVSST
jgi:hypothetical protein